MSIIKTDAISFHIFCNFQNSLKFCLIKSHFYIHIYNRQIVLIKLISIHVHIQIFLI